MDRTDGKYGTVGTYRMDVVDNYGPNGWNEWNRLKPRGSN